MSWVWFMSALGAGTTQYKMAAGSGSYVLNPSGVGATLKADTGAYALSGKVAGLNHERALAAAPGSYSLNGQNIADFVKFIRLDARRGEYRLVGRSALLIFERLPQQDPKPYVENAWVQPQDEGDLKADVIVEQG